MLTSTSSREEEPSYLVASHSSELPRPPTAKAPPRALGLDLWVLFRQENNSHALLHVYSLI